MDIVVWLDVIRDLCSIFPLIQLDYVLWVTTKVQSFFCHDPPFWWLTRKEKNHTKGVLKRMLKWKKTQEEKNEIKGFGIGFIYFKHLLLWSHWECCGYFEMHRLKEYVLVKSPHDCVVCFVLQWRQIRESWQAYGWFGSSEWELREQHFTLNTWVMSVSSLKWDSIDSSSSTYDNMPIWLFKVIRVIDLIFDIMVLTFISKNFLILFVCRSF